MICILHACTRDNKPLQFGKMSDQEQLQLVKELHSNNSGVPYFCRNISNYTSVERTRAYLEGQLGILDAVSIHLKAKNVS